ncbi:hypothetical protein C7212DRAFT_341883 [Tuber magnatum]|uniref:Uncharacterized protein n=1 Tax=Tuber magnatum TaxID=42249 RepID=A0A317SYV0_9PEZI|nr:hypothetical protein C7212DRAFT_341883 [Tuber magnatum]
MSQHTSIRLPLEECGEPNAGFWNRNDPSNLYQRDKLLQLGSKFTVQADLALVIHGSETPSGDPATLIYIKYDFVSESRTRHFRGAAIEFRFFTKARSGTTPVLEPEVAGGSITREISDTTHVQRKATIRGTKKSSDPYKYGINDIARWKISENPTDPGIPTNFTTAVLLRRKTQDSFAATIQIDAEIGARYKLEQAWDKLWGNKPVVDPVYFNPSLEPRGSMPVPEGLDTQNLKEFWDNQTIGSGAKV